jgi:hypothetical protein
MLSVRQFTTFPFVGAALLSYVALAHPLWLWQRRSGLAWMVCGATVAFLPIVPHLVGSQTLAGRLIETTALHWPDGSIRWDANLWAAQLARAFGVIVYYADSGPWGVVTGKPICLPFSACLFGAGLTYLLTTWRSPAGFVLLSITAVCIFLGGAVLTDPRQFYHYFAAFVAILLICGVAVDRILAPMDGWARGWGRVVRWGVVLLLVGTVVWSDLSVAWSSIQRAPRSRDGRPVYLGDATMMAARFMRENPAYRYYLVRSRADLSSAAYYFRWFMGEDSDLSDLVRPLDAALPVPPVEAGDGVAFLVLPSRAGERERISQVYPTAVAHEISFARTPAAVWWPPGPQSGSLWIYLVDAASARSVYQDSVGERTSAGRPAD